MAKSKMTVKKKFKNAMFKLRRMGKKKQQNVIAGASREFIKHISAYLSKIRRQPKLVKKRTCKPWAGMKMILGNSI